MAAAFAVLEQHAAVGRRGGAGCVSVVGEGLAGAAFRHRTSRAGDYTDGADILYDYGEHHQDCDAGRGALQLVVVTGGQRVFVPVIADYLRRIQYGDDGYPVLIRVPGYEQAQVVADPTRSFGAPIFERGGARVEDVLDRFWAGDSIQDLTAEFGVPAGQVEDLVRVASRRAA